ncbi:TPA: hypothetical protein I8Y95_000561 [Legionella pneumophila]|uniref:hypothetical protein n=1 Tax=Legionella pneumophila TaxID=446 RepID=UPI001374E017|nr:hypothetical protein [Legionella pneumophila]HAT9326885.1 hypothetical protein [Legionella pneumophila subsp. pneumophila]MCK1859547.1 hypothetical protein [Legionella pneumophila]HAT1811085.1 hypothetical protein [Legionella pneumophila]HAT2028514.1 hypothetical protein [Legionella pneumophila]HAT8308177.1 hypothetical protein [Legionella pneumophila]
MDKTSYAVNEIDKVISDNKVQLEGKYEKIEYNHQEGYIYLKCFIAHNQWRELSVGIDPLGPPPKFYTGLERQKRGGTKREIEDWENYQAKKQRIQETDGLIIKFKFHENGKTWEIAPTYHYSGTNFLEQFKSHFL